jgi:phenylalanyl-tRNA synthetase beta chain
LKILTQWLRDYLPGLTASDRELADDLTLRGIAVEGVFDLGKSNGSLFETDITTNRVDAMNHYGVAREAAAIYGLTLSPLATNAGTPGLVSETWVSAPPVVRIEAPDLCGRFTARILRDIHVQPSAGKIAERFRLLEQKQISNAVDATNYVLQAMGQPTHAFDLDKLEGDIVVRRARKGERLKLLDGTERTLEADDLVVADEKKALALAGVMGGWDSMITAETKNILVEAAWFDPSAIRRSARRHGLHTDASHRFERGADFSAPPVGSAMVCSLILEAGGHIASEFIDIIIPEAEARTAKRAAIALSVREVQRLLGATEDGQGVSGDTTKQVLSALGCELAPAGSGQYNVTLPSWRLDLEREIDLIEEVARVYGYNRFANTLPVFAGTVIELPHATHESTVRAFMLAQGFSEALTSTFCSAADAELFAPQPATSVAMGNPLNAEAGMLRPSLLPGMVTAIETNSSRNVADIRIFEMGTTFSGTTDRVDEHPALAFAAAGHTPSAGPHHAARSFDFYDAKGVMESLLKKIQYRTSYMDALLLPAWLHPGRSARCVVDGITVAYFGQLHPAEAQKRKLKQVVLVGEIYLHRLYTLPLRQPRLQELSRFQSVTRDFSFSFPDAVPWGQIAESMDDLALHDVMVYEPRELFRAAGAHAHQYSLLLSTVFQAPDRTLQDEEVQAWSKQVMEAMARLGGALRK